MLMKNTSIELHLQSDKYAYGGHAMQSIQQRYCMIRRQLLSYTLAIVLISLLAPRRK